MTWHLLPFFKGHLLSEITAQEADRYNAVKVPEREERLVERPLSNRTINKTLTRLGQILDAAVRYDLLPFNPVKGRVEKLIVAAPKRTRLSGRQVQALLKVAGKNRALLATAIMAGGLRVSELTHLRWRDLDLEAAIFRVPVSKTAAGLREIEWTEPDDFIFAGRIREKPRERNSVRTKILYPAVERANAQLTTEDLPTFPDGITFHSLRRTYAALRAELGGHPAVTAARWATAIAHDPSRLHRRHRDEAAHSHGRPGQRLGGKGPDSESKRNDPASQLPLFEEN